MDKKKVILIISLIVFMIAVILIYNLVIRKKEKPDNSINQNIVNKPENKEIISIKDGTVTCTSKTKEYHKIIFKVENDKITYNTLYFSRPIITFGISDDDPLTTEEKNLIGKDILKEMEIDGFHYKGVDIAYSTDDNNVYLKITVDYTNVDISILQKLGIYFNDKYSNIIKKILSTDEYACK